MIGFNKIKTKLKNNNANNQASPSPSQQQQQSPSPPPQQPLISKVKQCSPTFSSKSTTLSRKSMLKGRKVVIFGNKSDFLSNLLVTVLSQYECLVTLVFLQKPTDTANGNNNSTNNSGSLSIKTLEIDIEDKVKIIEIIKENDTVIACFEWCEFRSLYEQVKLLSLSLKQIYSDSSSGKDKSSLDKQIMIVYPIGVEDVEFNIDNISIEVIFDPLPVTFIFYSALMQWLFTGPPSISQPHLQLLLSKPTEGCYWLDCDDLIKAIVELMIQIDLSGTSKMLVLTGKEPLTCSHISNILLSECNIMVDDYVEDKVLVGNKILQKKFFTYLQSPISIVNSPSIEEIIGASPTSFSNFIGKCKETQLFTIKPSRSNSFKSKDNSSNGNGNNGIGMNATIATSTLTSSIDSSNNSNNNGDTKPPLSVSLDPKILNKSPSPPATPQQPPSATNSPTSSTSSSSSSSSYRFVFNPFNILKYSKDFIEETLYRPSANVNQSKKIVQDQETQQYINLLTIGFKKLFENEIESLSNTINNVNNNNNNGNNSLNSNHVNNNNSIGVSGDTPQSQTATTSISTPTSSPPVLKDSLPFNNSIEFSNEDFNFETQIEIPIDSVVDLEEEQHIHQFHHLQHPSNNVQSSSTTTISTSITTTSTTNPSADSSNTNTTTTTLSSLATITSNTESTTTTTTTTTISATASSSENWQFTIFSPKVFKEIRKYYCVDQDFLRVETASSISNPELNDIVKFLEVQTIGRSGSFFYKSEDSKYFIKTIPSNEFDTFVKIFPSYYQHIKKYPNTLLPRFFGMYRLKGKLKLSGASYYSSTHRDIIFVVMANLFYSEQKLEIKEKYDLKGSTIGRYVDINQIQQQLNEENQVNCNINNSIIPNQLNSSNSSCNNINSNSGNNSSIDNNNNNNSSGCGNNNNQIQIQDLTFKDLNLKRKIHLGGLKRAFITQLSIDSEWMSNHGICDYSLLVGLHISDKRSIRKLKDSQDPKTSLKRMDISFFKKDFNGIIESVHKTIPVYKISRDRSNSCSDTLDSNLNGINSPQPSLSTSSTIIRSNNENDDDEGIIYYLGLIDILTTYNLKKRGENAIKGMLFDRTQISAINPKDYQIRFIKYIESIFE